MSSICIDYLGTAILNNMLFWQLQSLKRAFCRNGSNKACHSDICAQEELLVATPRFGKNVGCPERVPGQGWGTVRTRTRQIDKAGLTSGSLWAMSRQPLFLATFTLHIITCSRGTPLFETVILSSLAVLTEETFKDNWCENTAILLFRSSKCEENVHIYSGLLVEAASARRKVLLDLRTLLKQQYLLTSSALVPSQSLNGEDSTTTTTQKSFCKDFFFPRVI